MGSFNGDVVILDEGGAVIDRAEASLSTSADGSGWKGYLNSQPGSHVRWNAGPVKLRLPSGDELPGVISDVEQIYSQGLNRQSAGVAGSGPAPF